SSSKRHSSPQSPPFKNYDKALRMKNLRSTTSSHKPHFESIPMCPMEVVKGIPVVKGIEAEVSKMNVIENLQHVVAEKFSYGWPNIQELNANAAGESLPNCEEHLEAETQENEEVKVTHNIKQGLIEFPEVIDTYSSVPGGDQTIF
ncbi:hypothetical protein HAX54_026137, partial [Datura stramonium]|nr:hypothetical protein [Datura stramonium]